MVGLACRIARLVRAARPASSRRSDRSGKRDLMLLADRDIVVIVDLVIPTHPCSQTERATNVTMAARLRPARKNPLQRHREIKETMRSPMVRKYRANITMTSKSRIVKARLKR